VAGLLKQLQTLAPSDPGTRFLEARWLMRNRDFKAAESVLRDLVAGAGEARFTFPINGKWIRPPWSSVQKKAKLNLAFLHDLRGDRDSALRLYRELLAAPDLDAEARAAGYAYDDIRWVIEDYTRRPFTGRPDEAFRHYRGRAAIPPCATRP
jgi:tetratricopeptide (TPR) repeat protein